MGSAKNTENVTVYDVYYLTKYHILFSMSEWVICSMGGQIFIAGCNSLYN